MHRYYFSGVDRESLVAQVNALHDANPRVGMMMHASVAGTPRMRRSLARYDLPAVIDSGATEAPMPLDRYRELLISYEGRLDWAASLDVLGDQRASARHWDHLRSCGHPVRYTFQIGGELEAEEVLPDLPPGEVVALGGLARRVRGAGPEQTIIEVYDAALPFIDAGHPVHLFGVGSFTILYYLGGEPWLHSADSSTWLLGRRVPQVIDVDGTRRRSEAPPHERIADTLRSYNRWISDTLDLPQVLWAEAVDPSRSFLTDSFCAYHDIPFGRLADLLVRYAQPAPLPGFDDGIDGHLAIGPHGQPLNLL